MKLHKLKLAHLRLCQEHYHCLTSLKVLHTSVSVYGTFFFFFFCKILRILLQILVLFLWSLRFTTNGFLVTDQALLEWMDQIYLSFVMGWWWW